MVKKTNFRLTLILVSILLALQFANVHASELRDFQNTQELEAWLEQDSQNASITTLRNDGCVVKANGIIKRAGRASYRLEQFTILSPYYFYQHYPSWWGFGDGGHAIVRVKVANEYYLIEPLYWMAWKFDESRSYVGKVSSW